MMNTHEATLNLHRILAAALLDLAIGDDEEISEDDLNSLAENLDAAAEVILEILALEVVSVDENGRATITVDVALPAELADPDA